MIRHITALTLFVSTVWVAGCSVVHDKTPGAAGDSSSSAGGSGGTGSTATGTGGMGGSGGSAGAGGMGNSSTYRRCVKACQVPADCADGNSDPVQSADNFECVNNFCHLLGCISDAECQESISGSICRSLVPGTSQPRCVMPCQTAADCAKPDWGPAYDADNYVCQDGGCFYDQCHSDEECAQSSAEHPRCALRFPTGKPICTYACENEFQCVQAPSGAPTPNLTDLDNYSCGEGFCQYLGCQSDEECHNGYGPTHSCR